MDRRLIHLLQQLHLHLHLHLLHLLHLHLLLYLLMLRLRLHLRQHSCRQRACRNQEDLRGSIGLLHHHLHVALLFQRLVVLLRGVLHLVPLIALLLLKHLLHELLQRVLLLLLWHELLLWRQLMPWRWLLLLLRSGSTGATRETTRETTRGARPPSCDLIGSPPESQALSEPAERRAELRAATKQSRKVEPAQKVGTERSLPHRRLTTTGFQVTGLEGGEQLCDRRARGNLGIPQSQRTRQAHRIYHGQQRPSTARKVSQVWICAVP
jgi:hypothetical protein